MKWFSLQIVLLSIFIAPISATFFLPGKEYNYNYVTTVSAGSKDYVSFESSYNITGKVKFQLPVGTNVLTVKLDDIKFGVYNGEFDTTSPPEIVLQSYQQLNPLTEPFQVIVGDNLQFTSVVLGQDVPEWAKNIQRGIVSSIQADVQSIDTDKKINFFVKEKTPLGECPTNYQVVKTNNDGGLIVRKFRSHVDCTNKPIRVRQPGIFVQHCPDPNTRDIINSTAFSVIELEIQNHIRVPKKIVSGSTLRSSVLSANGHVQFSFTKSTLTLDHVTETFKKLTGPTNPREFRDLRYVFGSEFTELDDLRVPQPYFFHYKKADTQAESLTLLRNILHDYLRLLTQSLTSADIFKDVFTFHKTSPFSVIPIVSSLDYDSLKLSYEQVKEEAITSNKITEKQLFLDALVISGSGPAALVIRDIVRDSLSNPDESATIARIIAPFPNYVRNPTESLLKEFEELVKPGLPKQNGRLVEFAFASLINRACQKSLCTKSGLLTKYVKFFTDKYRNANHFEEKTVAVAALRNIGIGGAADKLLSIVIDQNEDRTVRQAAVPGLRTFLQKGSTVFKDSVLPIFFNRSEHCELRNTVVLLYLMTDPDPRIINQLVLYMWTEKSQLIKNFLYTTLQGMAESTRPCLSVKGSHAKTALSMFPSWTVNRVYSGNYIRDYYDTEYNFGHMYHIIVHKSGKTSLPTSLYISFNGQLAGYGTSYLSLFVRIEGVGKALASRLMSITTGQINFDEVKDLFAKIGVEERQSEPLRIELGVLLHNRVVAYHAADAKTVTTVPMLLKKLAELHTGSKDFDVTRMLLLGAVTIEQPTEFGTPVSVIGGGTGIASFHFHRSGEKTQHVISGETEIRFQYNAFGVFSVNNHLPPFGTMHSVIAYRTLRVRVPRNIKVNIDLKNHDLSFEVKVPTEEDPSYGQVHATSVTELKSDSTNPTKSIQVQKFLLDSCPTCKSPAIISKGAEHRKGRKLGIPQLPYLEGVNRGIEYFDCEKVHTKIHVIRQLRKFFGPENKNTGELLPVQAILGVGYMTDSLFFSPETQTCGLKIYLFQDTAHPSALENIIGQFKIGYVKDPEKKFGTEINVKSKFDFKYTGVEPFIRTVNINTMSRFYPFEKIEFKLRLMGDDERSNHSGVACIDFTQLTQKPQDLFGFEGVNEGTLERKVKVTWGLKEDIIGECPVNAAEINWNRKSRRSLEQISEVSTDFWPYKQCRIQKNSGQFPGSLTPPTRECLQAVFEQTSLRESNITIEYKVDPEARRRWRRPGLLIASLLSPYWVDYDTKNDKKNPHYNHIQTKKDGKFIEGKIEIDVSARKESPSLDIHYHGSLGQEEHFHDVDLDVFPEIIRIRPVFSRFLPFWKTIIEMGIYSYCAVTPTAVITYDNYTYSTDLPQCPTLIAADCGPNPKFAILARKITADRIAITAYLGEHIVDLKDLNQVTVDEKVVQLSDRVYNSDEPVRLFRIVKLNDLNVFIFVEKLSVVIQYTGNYVTVSAGSRYRGVTCGLCGEFKGSSTPTFVGPQPSCKGLGPKDITKAYVTREGVCSGIGSPCPVVL